MRPSYRWLSGCLLLALAVGAGFRAIMIHPEESHAERTTAAPPPGKENRSEISADSHRTRGENPRILSDWSETGRWLGAEPAPAAEEVKERLHALRTSWAAMDPQTLGKTIGDLLRSGEDLKTGLHFEVGRHGLLDGWPTLRVFLLDALALSDPEMAASIARELLDQTNSADEYAVALRSLTREGLGRADNGELLSRFERMLARTDWQHERGFAEAFDMARFLGSQNAAESVTGWPGDSRLKAMALHEFAADHPEQAAAVVAADDSLDAAARACLMARTSPSDPIQAAAVETYLHDAATTPQETSVFLKYYPFRGATTGYRLYGKTPAPFSQEKIAADDRAALAQAERWFNDPALADHREEIRLLQVRLGEWIAQTK